MLIVKSVLVLLFIAASVISLRVNPSFEEFLKVRELDNQLKLGNRIRLAYRKGDQCYGLVVFDLKQLKSYPVKQSCFKYGICTIHTDYKIYYYVIILDFIITKKIRN